MKRRLIFDEQIGEDKRVMEDEDAPSLRLHMNVIFILMFGARSPDGNPSVLKVRTVLSNILSAMEPGTE